MIAAVRGRAGFLSVVSVTQQRSTEGHNALTEDHTATSLCGVQIELDECKKTKDTKL